MKLVVERRWDTHLLSNYEKDKLIEDYVNRETAVVIKSVEDPDTVIQQEQQDVRSTEKVGLTAR